MVGGFVLCVCVFVCVFTGVEMEHFQMRIKWKKRLTFYTHLRAHLKEKMSSRALRRALQREEDPDGVFAAAAAKRSSLSSSSSSSSEGNDSEEERRTPKKKNNENVFAAFLTMDDDDEEDKEEEEEKEDKAMMLKVEETEKTKRTIQTKKKKKKKEKEKEEDELEAALRDIGIEAPKARVPVLDDDDEEEKEKKRKSRKRWDELFACDVRKLKAEDELRRMFMSPSSNTVGGEFSGSGGSSSGSSIFARPKSGWSNKSRAIGLAMKKTKSVEEKFRGDFAYEEDSGDGEISYYQFSTGAAYEDANELFEKARETHDPRAITHLLMKYPLHAESLLAISDVHMVVGDADKGSDAIEQCLAAFEKSFHKDFIADVKKGTARIPIDPPGKAFIDEDKDEDESIFDVIDELSDRREKLEEAIEMWDRSREKTFLKALFKQTCSLTRRGCYNAALEVSKMLFSVEPKDYFCVGFIIDYAAIRSEKLEWLEEFLASLLERRVSPFDMWYRPNFSYSYAICLKLRDEQSKIKSNKADEAMRQAIMQHPLALYFLVEKLDLKTRDVEWFEIIERSSYFEKTTFRDNATSKNASYEFACKLFAERHHYLWRPERILSWMKAIAHSVCEEYERMNIILNRPTSSEEWKQEEEERDKIYAELNSVTWQMTRNANLEVKEGRNVASMYSHVSFEDYQDVVKRQLPEDDENPFLAPAPQQRNRNENNRQAALDVNDMNDLALIADAAERFAGRDDNVEWRENGIPEDELRNIAETHGRGNDPGAIGMMRAFFATLFRGDENNGDFQNDRLRDALQRQQYQQHQQ